jgi:hypothetical protein
LARSTWRHAQGLEHGEQVLGHRHLPEDRGLLAQVAHAQARSLEHGQPRHVVPVEQDLAAVRRDHPHGHAEGRGLARAVGPEQADDLALVDVEGDVLDDGAIAEALRQALRAEQRHRRSSWSFSG